MTVHCVYVEITLTIVFGSTVVQISGRRDCSVRGFIATFRANSGMLPHLGYDRPLHIFFQDHHSAVSLSFDAVYSLILVTSINNPQMKTVRSDVGGVFNFENMDYANRHEGQ